MKKEDLKKLKAKLSYLTAEENYLRDLYLKDLAVGNTEGPLLGYSSLDKQWLKYYNLDNKTKENNKTVYRALIDNNKDHLNDIALEYFYAKITFKKLFANIEKTAQALEINGIKKGDFVTICAPGIPETVYTFYALSKLGAVANMMAPHFDKNGFINRVSDCNSRLLIVMDDFYDEIKDAAKQSKIEKIIIVPTLNSSPIKVFSKKYKTNIKNNEINWNQFIKEGNSLVSTTEVEYKKDMPLTMVYSSGTTGASKGILLSNDSFLNSANSYFESGLDISRGQKFYQIIPTWFSTGISTSINLPLLCGATVFMDPRFERKAFVKNVIKAKPNYCVAATSIYEGLLDNPKLKNKDLSYFTNAFEGGEVLTKETALRINETFKEHNNHSSIKVGYGQCECGATITTQTDNTKHCNGSVGIPLPSINIQICDEEYNEVVVGNRGFILVKTPARMLEYYKNKDETNNYFYIDEFGQKWNCTGDIGYMDYDGNLFVEGRASDYSIINNQKIYNFDIEAAITNVEYVKMCDVLTSSYNNDELVAHIILDQKYMKENNISYNIDLLKNIQNEILKQTGNTDMIPNIFKIRDEFPCAKSGKRDILAMKNEQGGFIKVDYPCKNKILKRK